METSTSCSRSPEPGQQRPPRHARGGGRAQPDHHHRADGGRARPGRGPRHRLRNPSGEPEEDLRPLLHDEARGTGDGARTVARVRRGQGPPRTHPRAKPARKRDIVHDRASRRGAPPGEHRPGRGARFRSLSGHGVSSSTTTALSGLWPGHHSAASVDTAADGAEALARVRERGYDLVIGREDAADGWTRAPRRDPSPTAGAGAPDHLHDGRRREQETQAFLAELGAAAIAKRRRRCGPPGGGRRAARRARDGSITGQGRGIAGPDRERAAKDRRRQDGRASTMARASSSGRSRARTPPAARRRSAASRSISASRTSSSPISS